MDEAWVQHVSAILEYLDGRAQAPNDQALQSARDLMASLDAWSFFGSSSHYGLQVRALGILQRIAYHDVDHGSVVDIANWALDRWLRILNRHPRSIPALRGVGSWWLSRSQPCLARIHSAEGSSSGSEASRYIGGEANAQTAEDGEMAEQAQREADARLGTSDYVEARGLLQPATDYLRRAVDEAASQSSLTGQLLTMAAEGFMSFGNVSSSRDGEGLFRQAIYYLRQASDIPGFAMPAHLQRWLDEYGPFVE